LFPVVLAPPVELFGFMFIVLPVPEPFRLDEPALFACCEPPMLHGEFCVAPVFRPELVPVLESVELVPEPALDDPALEPPPPDCANAIPPLAAMPSAVAAARIVRLFIKDSLSKAVPPPTRGSAKGFPRMKKDRRNGACYVPLSRNTRGVKLINWRSRGTAIARKLRGVLEFGGR
jgi:hypothetical protein